MNRNLMSNLLLWKDKIIKSPLLPLGARQVGKTNLLKQFAQDNYKRSNLYKI